MARDLTPVVTLGAFAAGLAVVFVAALGVGRAVGPIGTIDSGEHASTHQQTPSGSHDAGGQDSTARQQR